MCEILWEDEAYDAAEQFLVNVPPPLAESLPLQMLVGETRLRAGRAMQAAELYQNLLQVHDWDPVVAQALAGAFEAGGHNDRARGLYGEIIGTCTGCGTRVDPLVKQRFAETSFAAGDYSFEVLELYLELVQADPANRSTYYQRISHIYGHQGNDHEARRFAAFAEQSDSGFQAEN
jgi:predicted Zn-dependent protease